MTVDESGSVSDCEILQIEGNVPRGFHEDDPCNDMNRRSDVYRDENGEPVPKKVRLRMSVEVEDMPASD